MDNNIIQTSSGTIIMNGGNPLNDCPTSWDEARAWQAKVNEGRIDGDVKWSWDCGFKLDFDGKLGKHGEVSSRFYPPKTHYGLTWDGDTDVSFFKILHFNKKFDCATLEELHAQVEAWVNRPLFRLLRLI